MEIEFLDIRQLSARYPVAGLNNDAAWHRLLLRWRDQRRLQEGVHWKQRRAANAARRPTYIFDEVRVMRLILQSDASFAISVRLENRQAIERLIAAHTLPERMRPATPTILGGNRQEVAV